MGSILMLIITPLYFLGVLYLACLIIKKVFKNNGRQ